MWTKHTEVDLSISETSDRHGSFSLAFSYIVHSIRSKPPPFSFRVVSKV